MIKKKSIRAHSSLLTGSLILLLLPISALAHPGHEMVTVYSGILHPLTGLDHLLTAIAVGLFTAYAHNKFKWIIPLGFVTAMACGIFAGQLGIILPFYEQGIALSLGLLGAFLLLNKHLSSWRGSLLVACFGFFHGNAHGAELGHGSISLSATLGLMLSTVMLIILGNFSAILIQKMLTNERASWVLRIFGAGLIGSAFVV
jgi:urease accessory protein